MMKKVLVIGYFWPYIGGSKRVIGLAKFLSKFGWQPIILTGPLQQKPDSEFMIIETDYRCFLGSWVRLFGFNQKMNIGDQLKAEFEKTSRGIKFFLKFFYNFVKEIIAYPSENKGWKPFALKAVSEFLQKDSIDAIISIWPITSHIIAYELKKIYRTPWIADFPDLWSQNSAYPYGPLRRMFDRRLEKKILKSANALITSSWPLAERLKSLHKGKSISAIMLGFDPDMVNEPPSNLTTKFTITYTGIFYPKKRHPSTFLAALSDLISDGIIDPNEIEVRFYGPKKDWVEREIEKNKLSTVVKQYGIITVDKCFEKQRESQILLQLNWDDPKEKGVFSGKLLDYLAAKRPILAAGGSGNDEVVKKILLKTGTGVYGSGIKDVKSFLHKFYLEYIQKKKIDYKGNWEEVKKYSNQEMARKFADILNQITEK